MRRRILRWGRQNYVSYPWREDRDAWLTLAAELLLQRTRAPQALGAYEVLRTRYGTPARMLRAGRRGARALTRRVGLYAREETLLGLARLFEEGGVPETADEIREVTGVGAYTAGAWLSLHRGRRSAIIDSNVFRWLGRMVGRPYHRDPRHVAWVTELAERLTPRRAFRDYNYAVLDFTMTICTPRNPRCLECPVRDLCSHGRAITRSKGSGP